MRTTLTLIAVALVAALSAALVAPLFIDWTSYRPQIEAALGDALGARVTISKAINIRFLPTPYVELADVKIFDLERGTPALAADAVRLEAALGSLATGRLRFPLIRLDHPVLTLAREADGSLRVPSWRIKAQPGRIAVERLVMTGGGFRLEGGQAPSDLEGLEADATADSLLGPYRGSLSIPSRGGTAEFRFAAGAWDGPTMPLKIQVVTSSGLPSGVFDGAVTISRGGKGLDLAYAGSAAVAGALAAGDAEPSSPWSVSGALRADFHRVTLDSVVARFGPDERALEATGSAALEMGASPGLSADLQAKQLNVDALLRKEGEDSASAARALALLARVVSPLGATGDVPLPIRLSVSTPTIIVGAQSLSDVSLNVRASPASPIEGDLTVGLPGQSSLRLNGSLELGSATQFKGHIAADLGDLAQLRDWAARDNPDLARRLSLLEDALPYRKASASGDVEISAVGFAARNLKMIVDRTALSGAAAYTLPLNQERGRLYFDLTSDALDVDSLPNLRASAAALGDVDLSLALEAGKLRIARVGQSAVDSGSLSLKMTKTGDETALDRLSIAGLGGASVEARGASGAQGRWLSVQLKADRLREFAAMAARVAPGPVTRLFAQRAEALSPAKAAFEARAGGNEADGALLDSLKADGEAGQTRFSLKAERASAGSSTVVATFTLDAAEGSELLRQIGLKSPSASIGRAHVEASANGRWDNGFDASAAASIAGANLTWRGRFKPSAIGGDEPPVFGAGSVKADNALAALAALGLASAPANLTVPVDLTGDLVWRDGALRFPRVVGAVAGSKVTGRLDWRPPAEPAPISDAEAEIALARSVAGEAPISATTQIEGELAIDRASAGALLGLALGPSQSARPGTKWSEAPFAPPVLEPPPLDVQLKIDGLDIADKLTAHGASAHLKMDRDRFDLDDLAMDLGPGRASGHMTVRRDGAIATLEGQLSLDLPAMERAGLRGGLGARAAFASTGQSPNSLVAGLVGDGSVETSNLAIPRLDPAALSRVLAAAQGPDARIDETNIAHALGIEFDKQPMVIPDGTAPLAMTGGVLRVGPFRLAGRSGEGSVGADFDIRSEELTIHAAFAESEGGKFWTGPAPRVAVTLSGSPDAPGRQIDVSGLVAGLAAQAIARESDRISAMEADIRERAAFNRRLKAEQFLRQRQAELDAYAAEQARIKSEEARKRVEDELLKDSEAQRDKAAPPPAVSSPPPQEAPGPAAARKVAPSATDPTATGLY